MKRRLLSFLLALTFILGSVHSSLANGDGMEKIKVSIQLKDHENKLFSKEELENSDLFVKDITGDKEEILEIGFLEDDSTPKEAYFYFEVEKNNEERKISIESSKYDFSKLEGKEIPAGYTFEDGILRIKGKADSNTILLQGIEKVKRHKLSVNFEKPFNSKIKMKINDTLIEGDEYHGNLEEGRYEISFDIPENSKHLKVVPSPDPGKGMSIKEGAGVYSLDLKEDTTLYFVVNSSALGFTMDDIAVGDLRFHGKLNQVDSNVNYEAYVIYQEEEALKQAKGTVRGLGLIEFKDKVRPSLGDELSFYIYDKTNKLYSDVVTVKVGYQKLPVEIDEVYEDQAYITGTFDTKNFDPRKENVYFELYKVKEDGSKEEDPYTVFKQKEDNTIESVELFDIKADKTFALNNKVKFTAGDQFVLLAKAGEVYQKEIEFEVLSKGEVKRLAGKDRYATALDTAKEAYDKTDTVILAYGEVAADALAAGPLANALDAPIVLTGKDRLYQGIQNFIETREVKKVIIVGGTGSVSNAVKNELNDVEVTRISGKDRFETSVEVAEILVENHGFSKEHIIITNGYVDADALAVAPLATQEKQVILLARKDLLPKAVQDFVREKEVVKGTIAGGKGTIDDDVLVKNELRIVERISGSDRYATSLEIAKRLKNLDGAIFVNGFKSPDALTSAPLAKVKNAGILLVKDPIVNKENDPGIQYIKEKEIKKIYLAGGTGSLEKALETYFNDYLNDVEK